MTMEDEPTLEQALDGLMNAATYADQRISENLCYRISELYQEVGERAPEEDWDAPEKNVVREIEIDEIE